MAFHGGVVMYCSSLPAHVGLGDAGEQSVQPEPDIVHRRQREGNPEQTVLEHRHARLHQLQGQLHQRIRQPLAVGPLLAQQHVQAKHAERQHGEKARPDEQRWRPDAQVPAVPEAGIADVVFIHRIGVADEQPFRQVGDDVALPAVGWVGVLEGVGQNRSDDLDQVVRCHHRGHQGKEVDGHQFRW